MKQKGGEELREGSSPQPISNLDSAENFAWVSSINSSVRVIDQVAVQGAEEGLRRG